MMYCKKIASIVTSVFLGSTLLCGQTAVHADQAELFLSERFFLFDGDDEPVFGSTADGKLKFEIIGQYAVMQGDMVLGNAQNLVMQHDVLTQRGIARTNLWDRWIDGIVYYQFDDSLNAEDISKIQQAIDHWNERSTLTLIERTQANASTIPDFINFEAAAGCASYVGRNGGSQALWVAPQCSVGSVIHEIGHAVGLFHEHTRADRDNYISVLWDNITPGREFNFDIMDAGVEPIGDYDFGSIMHYGTSYFSNSGGDTIIAPDNVTIGQRQALSDGDLAAVNSMYATDLMLSTESTSTTEVTLTVTNNGPQGAHAITVDLPVPDISKARTFQGDGWDCSSQNNTISCELDRLAEAMSSTVSIQFDDHDTAIDASNASLSSKTHDTNRSNNGDITNSAPPTTEIEGSNQTPDNPVTSGETQGNEEQTDSDKGTESNGLSGTNNEPDANNNAEPSEPEAGGQNPSTISIGNTPSSPTTQPELGAAESGDNGGGGATWWLILLTLLAGLPRQYHARRHT